MQKCLITHCWRCNKYLCLNELLDVCPNGYLADHLNFVVHHVSRHENSGLTLWNDEHQAAMSNKTFT